MRHFDLLVIGSGSGDVVVGRRPAGWKVAYADDGAVGFGGTCLNVGCIPSKMFVHTADLVRAIAEAGTFGLGSPATEVDWKRIRQRVFERIDRHSADKRRHQSQDSPGVTLFEGAARFTGPHTVQVADGAEEIRADRIVVATGSRPVVPDIPGLAESGYLTSDTVMRIEELPRRLIVLGGGAITAEFAHVFSALGVHVSVIARSAGMLAKEDEEVAALFTTTARRRWYLRDHRTAIRVDHENGSVRVHLRGSAGTDEVVEGDALLVAVGRRPNSDRLDLPAAGITVRDDGRVAVDAGQRTNLPHVFALGDISSDHLLKHVANHEARVVAHNMQHPDAPIEADHRFVPHAVFTAPQIASVGLTEQRARAEGIPHVVSKRDYSSIAYGWAMEDPEGFAKILADPATGRLLGAHIIGPEASSLIQPLVQAMSLGQDAATVAHGQYWIHPALSELVENALLDLDLPKKDPE